MPGKGRPSKVNEEIVIARLEQGEYGKDIADSFNVSPALISRIARKHGVKTQPGSKEKITNATIDEALIWYHDGHTLRETARKFNISYGALRKRFVKRDVDIKPYAYELPIEEIRRLYEEEQWSQQQIATHFQVSQVVISRRLIDAGVSPREDWHLRRENHGSWKGGRITQGSGYIMIRLPHEHPFFESMCGSGGYILEHRLVMAEHLGRPLTQSETVHHINGDRTDNRLANLQLRHGKHGKHEAFQCGECGSHNVIPIPLY